MIIDYKNWKITKFDLHNDYIYQIDNFLNKESFKKIQNEITILEDLDKNPKSFKFKKKKVKKEYNNYSLFLTNQKKLMRELDDNFFKNKIKSLIKKNNTLYSDKTHMFTSFNIVKKGGFLKPHADFNFNNGIKKFRTLNLIIYFNKNWKKEYGGNLSFYDYSSNKKIKEVLAKENRCLIFLTNKFTLHGYKKIKYSKLKRLSLNYYYYTKENLSYSKEIHKTLWRC